MTSFLVAGRNDNVVIQGFYDKLASGMTVYQALTALDDEVYDYYDGDQLDFAVEPFRYRNCIGDNSLVYNISEYALN